MPMTPAQNGALPVVAVQIAASPQARNLGSPVTQMSLWGEQLPTLWGTQTLLSLFPCFGSFPWQTPELQLLSLPPEERDAAHCG